MKRQKHYGRQSHHNWSITDGRQNTHNTECNERHWRQRRTYWHHRVQETCVDIQWYATSSEDTGQPSVDTHCPDTTQTHNIIWRHRATVCRYSLPWHNTDTHTDQRLTTRDTITVITQQHTTNCWHNKGWVFFFNWIFSSLDIQWCHGVCWGNQ